MTLAFSRTKLVCEACKDKDASSKARPDRHNRVLCDICYEDAEEEPPTVHTYGVGDVWLCSMGFRWVITDVVPVVRARKLTKTTTAFWTASGKRVNFPHHSLVTLVTCERWIAFKHMAPPPSCDGDGRALITTPGARRGRSLLLQPMFDGEWRYYEYSAHSACNDLGHSHWKLIELPHV